MLKLPRRYIDFFNIVLIVATCALSHFYPYHLLVVSYAILGPAHYLTQISWLHDRNYFTRSRRIAPVFACLSGLLVILFFYTGDHEVIWITLIFALCLGAAAYLTIPPENKRWRMTAVIVTAAIMILDYLWPSLALFIAILLPTVLHVFIFTAAFMWVGAVKSGKTAAYVSVFALLICAATFWIPGASETAPDLLGVTFFRPVVLFMQDILGMSPQTETQLFGFLSFAYTYHYLNWFSKAEVINWHQIPKERMNVIIVIYVATIAAYTYNYAVGFLLILLLAHLHVLLEFPLNMRTFAAMVRRGA